MFVLVTQQAENFVYSSLAVYKNVLFARNLKATTQMFYIVFPLDYILLDC